VASADALYTPEVLALATELADLPLDDGLPLQETARSRSCGSTLTLGLASDADGTIRRVGMKAQACAIGQAAAAIFAAAAPGRNLADIEAAERAISAWLAGDGAMPDWPRLQAIAGARDFPGRHGAILLAWTAARMALAGGALHQTSKPR